MTKININHWRNPRSANSLIVKNEHQQPANGEKHHINNMRNINNKQRNEQYNKEQQTAITMNNIMNSSNNDSMNNKQQTWKNIHCLIMQKIQCQIVGLQLSFCSASVSAHCLQMRKMRCQICYSQNVHECQNSLTKFWQTSSWLHKCQNLVWPNFYLFNFRRPWLVMNNTSLECLQKELTQSKWPRSFKLLALISDGKMWWPCTETGDVDAAVPALRWIWNP